MPLEFPSPDFFGHTLFCDDIRYEVGGKVSYIGTYFGAMYVNAEFPLTLPKFALSITFAQLKKRFDPNFAAWIFFPGDPDEKPSVVADFPTVHAHMALGGDYTMAQAHFVLSPLTIQMPGEIKVRVFRQNELHRLGRLKVDRPPPSAPSA